MYRFAWLALISLACSTTPPRQPSPAPTSPERLAAAVLAADSAGDWATLLRLAHPDALEEFQRTQARMLEPSIFQGLNLDSCMLGPRFAEFAKQRESHLRFTLDTIFLVPTVDSLKGLSPDSAFARYGRHAARIRRPPQDPHRPKRTILDAVAGPAGASYVIVHKHYATLPLPDWPREQTEIMTFRKVGGAWRSMLDGPVELGSASTVTAFEVGD